MKASTRNNWQTGQPGQLHKLSSLKLETRGGSICKLEKGDFGPI
jgi:hypothetical protein